MPPSALNERSRGTRLLGWSAGYGLWCRTRHYVVMAARTPEGRISLRSLRLPHPGVAQPLWSLPIVRIWVQGLEWSRWTAEAWGYAATLRLGGVPILQAMAGALAMALACVAVPSVLLWLWGPRDWLDSEAGRLTWMALEGGLRAVCSLLTLLALRFVGPSRRWLRQEGARARALLTWEAGDDLTLENARRHRWFHPRSPGAGVWAAGVLGLILLSAVHPWVLERLQEGAWSVAWAEPAAFTAAVLMWLPLVALAGEATRLGFRFPLLQAACSARPDDAQTELALAAVRQILRLERGLPSPARARSPVVSPEGDEEEFTVDRLEDLGGIQAAAADLAEI